MHRTRISSIGLLFISSFSITWMACTSSRDIPEKELKYQEVKTGELLNGKKLDSSDLDTFPKYRGGIDGIMKHIMYNVRYPSKAKNNGKEGQIVVSFVVGKDGGVKEVKTEKSISPSLDQEAERVVSTLNEWKPGIHDGDTVQVRYRIPVRFTLN